MAAAAAFDYTATYGNVAYDIPGRRTAVPGEIPYDIPYERPREKTREREIPRERVRSKENTAAGIPLFAAAGFLLAAVLMVFVLLSYVQLAEISKSTTTLETTLSSLTDEEDRLRVQYEKAFNLTEVEKYATGTLGMTKLTPENTKTVEMEHADKAEILGTDDSTGRGLVSELSGYLSSLLEYFK